MENFMLWNAVVAAGPGRFSFYATRMQWPCLYRGTREAIDHMLVDLDLSGLKYTSWTIKHLRCNFYASPGEPATSEDAWMDTWEVTLALAGPAPATAISVNQRLEIVRTLARDETWDGSDPPSQAPYVLVARFYNEQLFGRALAAFSEMSAPRGFIDPEVADLVKAVQRHPLSSGLRVQERRAGALTLEIELGVFDAKSFHERAGDLLASASELIVELGGTMTWDQMSDFLQR
jgi:hypothetical protein